MIATPQFKQRLTELYRADDAILAKQTSRYHALIQEFQNRFQDYPLHLFSTPGRTEIGGNHNVYFNKPCGLMDQLACAVGGIVAIDFANPQQPRRKNRICFCPPEFQYDRRRHR